MGRSYFEARLLRASTKKKEILGEIPYGQPSDDLGGFFEILRSKCFADSLASGAKIHSLWQHDQAKPLGNTANGTLILTDTPKALKVKITPPNTSWGRDALESIGRGDVTGFSFGFRVEEDSWPKQNLREIHRAELVEVSPVTFAAYGGSIAAVARSLMSVQDRKPDQKAKAIVIGPGLVGFPTDDEIDWSQGVFE